MSTTNGNYGPLVGAIDEGTSSARFLVFSARTSEIVATHQIETCNIYPQEGWVEQDPIAILKAVQDCIRNAVESLKEKDVYLSDIVAIGVTNQRETTVAWDMTTGEPLHNAIIWLDVRTASTVDHLLEKVPGKDKNFLKSRCGLPLSPYFSGVKIHWLIENVPSIKEAIKEKRCCFGTIDSWIIWNLTGGKNGGIHITDVSNASRTMLMNLDTLDWDPELCKFFHIPVELLPKICSSSEIYAHIAEGPLQGIPISGVSISHCTASKLCAPPCPHLWRVQCLGDQHAALVGQACFSRGQAKSTYGTGCFLLYNTGTAKVLSSHGLITTVAYQLGRAARPVYALEGSVAVAGAALRWLRDNINLLDDVAQSESLADSVLCTGDVYFVPAFSGLYAPYWQQDARGVICGISEDTTQGHIIRATLEAICFQTRDILEAMNKDCGTTLTKLQVDGGMTANTLLMQLQADLVGITVMRPQMAETTALGAAIAAGSASGINIWDLSKIQPLPCDKFKPQITDNDRDVRYSKWKMAVERSMGWDVSH